MADTSLNENRLALLIWQTANLWQSKVRIKLKESEITLNEYLILETIYLLQKKIKSHGGGHPRAHTPCPPHRNTTATLGGRRPRAEARRVAASSIL